MGAKLCVCVCVVCNNGNNSNFTGKTFQNFGHYLKENSCHDTLILQIHKYYHYVHVKTCKSHSYPWVTCDYGVLFPQTVNYMLHMVNRHYLTSC